MKLISFILKATFNLKATLSQWKVLNNGLKSTLLWKLFHPNGSGLIKSQNCLLVYNRCAFGNTAINLYVYVSLRFTAVSYPLHLLMPLTCTSFNPLKFQWPILRPIKVSFPGTGIRRGGLSLSCLECSFIFPVGVLPQYWQCRCKFYTMIN